MQRRGCSLDADGGGGRGEVEVEVAEVDLVDVWLQTTPMSSFKPPRQLLTHSKVKVNAKPS